MAEEKISVVGIDAQTGDELSKAREDDAIREMLKIVVKLGNQELITALMENVGAYYQADRCYIFAADSTGKYIANTHEWCADGVVPEKDSLQEVPLRRWTPGSKNSRLRERFI